MFGFITSGLLCALFPEISFPLPFPVLPFPLLSSPWSGISGSFLSSSSTTRSEPLTSSFSSTISAEKSTYFVTLTLFPLSAN